MKLLVLLLLFQVQQQNIFTFDQVLAWRTYYGLPSHKDVSEALKVLREPDITSKSVAQRWQFCIKLKTVHLSMRFTVFYNFTV
jgi:hypothetical protein